MSGAWTAVERDQRDRRVQRKKMQLAQARADEAVLSADWVQPIIARIGAAIDPDYPDRSDYCRRIVLDVVSARLRPRSHYAPDPKFSTAATGTPLDGTHAGGREGGNHAS